MQGLAHAISNDSATAPLLHLEGVTRWYGTQCALRDVTLHVNQGRIGLLGPNGAGKSTLLKILLGLIPPSSGSGSVLGHDLATAGADLRRAIGYMPEADALIPGLRGAEYVSLAGELYGMPKRQAQRRAHEVLSYLDLEDARYRYLEEYSTGMKQRLKLAQALIHDPPVLLLDEPTSGLDPAGRDAMLDLLLTLGKEHGKSMLLSTHLLGDVERVCDKVVILNHGQVLLQGEVAELRTRRQDRYRLQIQGPSAAFLEELLLEGVRIIEDNGKGELRVAAPSGWVTRAFFALADNHGVLLRGLQRDDEDLEELFHRVLAETGRNGASLLHYRPWRGTLSGPMFTIWPIARVALGMILRRKLFWAIYALGLMVFLLFFFGQYLLVWAETQTSEQSIRVGLVKTEPAQLIRLLREVLKLNGSGETYRNFFWYQGYIVMVLLSLAGAILVGNDFHFGTLPYYLSKPLGRWHYLLGKCCAVAVLVNFMTTVPAVILFVQYGLLDSWEYFIDRVNLLAGIIGYGLVLTICLSLMLVATATWLRRTVPLIMTWTTLFFFFRLLSAALVEGLQYDARWRLIDLWHNTYLVGNYLLGLPAQAVRPDPQPPVIAAALVLGAVSIACLSYLNLRIQAVEIVR